MVGKRSRKEWADPNREGRAKGGKAQRTCSKCGNTLQQARILKSLNLCEYCVTDLKEKRDGIMSCRGCGKIAPLELKEHNGYCAQCVCGACGRPDPGYVRKTGLCFQCAVKLGDFCRSCGKEAAAQVRKNKGFCDDCMTGKRRQTPDHSFKNAGFHGERRRTSFRKSSTHSLPGNKPVKSGTIVKRFLATPLNEHVRRSERPSRFDR